MRLKPWPNDNLRSYPPSLNLDAGKEAMIHLHAGSYVKKTDSVFFFSDWSRNNIYGLLSSDKQSYFKETCGQKLARKRALTKRVLRGRVCFCFS